MKNFRLFPKIIHKSAISLFLAIILAITLLCPAFAAEEPPSVNANAALLIEPLSGTILFSKNENQRVYPASTTKVMTALLAIEAVERGELKLTDVITASEASRYDITEDSSTQNIMPGEELTVESLLYCALVSSANEACNILAQAVSGDIPAFIELMNERAKELGCKDTHYTNTHGLTDENHYTTAMDMYIIFSTAQTQPLFKTITATAKYYIQPTNMSGQRELINTNKLIRKDSGIFCGYCTGGKTGSTTAAGYCLVAAAENNGVSFVSVVMGSDTETQSDGTLLAHSFTDTKKLYEWGFKNFNWHTAATTSMIVASPTVTLGEEADHINLVPEKDVLVFCDAQVTDSDFKFEVNLREANGSSELQAPINAGDKLGTLTVSLNGQVCETVDLVAATSINLRKIEFIKMKLKQTLSSTVVKLILIVFVLLVALYIVYIVMYNKRRRKKQQEGKKRIQQLEKERREGAQFKSGEKNEGGKPMTFEDYYNKK